MAASDLALATVHGGELSAFNITTLPPNLKTCLLKTTEVDSTVQGGEVEVLVSNLERFYPAARAEFAPKLSAGFPTSLRLLCNTVEGRYIALSYCWHCPGHRLASGYEETSDGGREWPISVRLLRCVLDKRLSENEGLWIDALCIDQKGEEKKAAVGSMDVIYSQARLVVVVSKTSY